MKNSQLPPAWALRFLHWFCKDSIVEETEGDIIELYINRKSQLNKYASILAVLDVLRFFKPSNFKNNFLNNISMNFLMINSYFKLGFRNIRKNKISSLINISGLSIALACTFVLLSYADFFLHMDGFHQNKENIYQIISSIQKK